MASPFAQARRRLDLRVDLEHGALHRIGKRWVGDRQRLERASRIEKNDSELGGACALLTTWHEERRVCECASDRTSACASKRERASGGRRGRGRGRVCVWAWACGAGFCLREAEALLIPFGDAHACGDARVARENCAGESRGKRRAPARRTAKCFEGGKPRRPLSRCTSDAKMSIYRVNGLLDDQVQNVSFASSVPLQTCPPFARHLWTKAVFQRKDSSWLTTRGEDRRSKLTLERDNVIVRARKGFSACAPHRHLRAHTQHARGSHARLHSVRTSMGRRGAGGAGQRKG
eukprot:6192895-Pleurochrysis_carterae.AAC.2